MPVREIARELQGKAANLALRMPISWVNILAGPPVTVDGRTLDGRTQWFLQLLARSGRPPIETMSVTDARAEFDASLPVLAGRPAPVGEIVDRTIEGPAGRLRIRIYRPAGTVARLLPTILYFHGGGWVIGSLEGYDLPCRYFCARTGCTLVSVDYRLAPEHKFPAAIEDAVAAYRWLEAEGTGLGIDPARIVIAGDSAGGNIAAVAARLLREEARPPCLQWLIYPVTDCAMDTPSHKSCGEGFLLTHAGMDVVPQPLPERSERSRRSTGLAAARRRPFRRGAGAGIYRGLRSAARRRPCLCRPSCGGGREDHSPRIRLADPRLCRHAGRLAGGSQGDG